MKKDLVRLGDQLICQMEVGKGDWIQMETQKGSVLFLFPPIEMEKPILQGEG